MRRGAHAGLELKERRGVVVVGRARAARVALDNARSRRTWRAILASADIVKCSPKPPPPSPPRAAPAAGARALSRARARRPELGREAQVRGERALRRSRARAAARRRPTGTWPRRAAARAARAPSPRPRRPRAAAAHSASSSRGSRAGAAGAASQRSAPSASSARPSGPPWVAHRRSKPPAKPAARPSTAARATAARAGSSPTSEPDRRPPCRCTMPAIAATSSSCHSIREVCAPRRQAGEHAGVGQVGYGARSSGLISSPRDDETHLLALSLAWRRARFPAEARDG